MGFHRVLPSVEAISRCATVQAGLIAFLSS